MYLSKSKCWYPNNCLKILKECCSITVVCVEILQYLVENL